jgi:hypothetical protein
VAAAGRDEPRERHAARKRTALQTVSLELAGTHEDRQELWQDGRGRRNGVVPTPPGWRQVVWRCFGLNRAGGIVNSHGDGGNSAWLTEEITYKA